VCPEEVVNLLYLPFEDYMTRWADKKINLARIRLDRTDKVQVIMGRNP